MRKEHFREKGMLRVGKKLNKAYNTARERIKKKIKTRELKAN